MFDVKSDEHELRIVFSASYSNVDLVCDQITGKMEDIKWDLNNFNIQLMLREALNNAVKHGCNEDPRREIVFVMSISNDELVWHVDDGGDGFNWREMLESDECYPEDCSGRGLPIFKLYASDVYFNEKGNCLTLKVRKH